MTLHNSIIHSLYGAYRLACIDKGGFSYFNTDSTGFWHSFRASILVFPLYTITISSRWLADTAEVSNWRFLLVHIISYVISWTAFPVIMNWLCRVLNRRDNYIQLIIAYNWAAVLQSLIYLPIVFMGALGYDGLSSVSLIAFVLVVFYNFFIIYAALDISISSALGIITLDLIIALVLGMWTELLTTNPIIISS